MPEQILVFELEYEKLRNDKDIVRKNKKLVAKMQLQNEKLKK
jgi:hypothetical protein